MASVIMILLLAVPALCDPVSIYPEHEVDDEIQYLGCFRESRNPVLALPVHHGSLGGCIYERFIQCRNTVINHGHDVFGFKRDDKCFSGDTAADTYDMFGYSNNCDYDAEAPCSSNARDVFANVYKTTSCQKEMFEIFCNNGGTIQIVDGFYGRNGAGVCGDDAEEGETCQSDVTNILKKLCDGETYCTKNTVFSVFGDPCNHQPKHLDIRYYCGHRNLPPLDLGNGGDDDDEDSETEGDLIRLGCFRDVQIGDGRALPEAMGELNGECSSILEMCADLAVHYDVFGIRPAIDSTPAKCFSGDDAGDEYDIYGVKDECEGWNAREVYAYVKRSVTCQKEMMELSCDSGEIRILAAYYGWGGLLDVCGNEVDAESPCVEDVKEIVQGICEGKTSCRKNTVMSVYGNPCPDDRAKHLVVTYYCGHPRLPLLA
ncbi:uncharacterized protein LOC100378737 [Saccoglossus kowalevskii]|uniref:Uncharacterized protein LOC100378737 n=1 Tax=Saccoglossus kowalevskii TaxID=10224 RepID=A0ABM0GXB1_SACKO|nr:PREDICTED: uncharacterized protein LOC100378737 [Saccoglossus kowalevskii]